MQTPAPVAIQILYHALNSYDVVPVNWEPGVILCGCVCAYAHHMCSEILIEILTFSFMKMRLKVSSAKCRPFRLGLSVLNAQPNIKTSGSHGSV